MSLPKKSSKRSTSMIKKNNLKIHFAYSLLLILILYSCSEKVNNKLIENGMFMNNNQHTGNYESPSVTSKPDLLWKVKTGGQVTSSPVLANGIVYIGSEDHKLYAIDATTGLIKWVFKTEGPVCSTPLVAQGKAMFLSYDDFFYALNQKDGSLVWKFKTQGESKFHVKDYYNGEFKPDFWDFYLSSAAHYNEMVYFGSSDSNIYALDIGSGKKAWSYKTGGSIHSSPAIFNNSLVIGSWDSKIYCIDATSGKENWTYSTGRDTAYYVWLGIQASPSIDSGIVYVGSRDAKFYAISIETGDTLWTNNNFNLSWMPSSASIRNENLYTGSSDSFSFFSISKQDGNINYATKTNAYTFSSPAIDKEMAYIGSANGRLYGIELDNGEIMWEFPTIGCQNDTINVFDSDGKMNIEKIKKLMEDIQDMPTLSALYKDIFINTGSILSSPIISNQVIYFGSSDGFVYAITDK